MTELRLQTAGVEQTVAVGRALGRLLRGRELVALQGPLGAGKTHFVKGLAAGLDVPADEPVVSPTFVLIREYVGRVTLYHIDAYRLGGTEELMDLGLDEMMRQEDAVVAIEWSDRTPEVVPATACRVFMDHAGAEERLVRVEWGDQERLKQLAAGVGR